MSFAEAIRTCLRSYVTFSGRARRSEYWWFALFVLLGQIVLGLLDSALFGTGPDAARILNPLFALATFLPSLAVSARRLHDIGRSAWWLLIGLVPLIGALVLLWWHTRPSEPGTNRFGPPPGGTPLEGTPDDPASLSDSAVPRVPRGEPGGRPRHGPHDRPGGEPGDEAGGGPGHAPSREGVVTLTVAPLAA